jgi:CBS domain-containing protein
VTKLVRDLMRPNLITCPAGTSLADAVAMLARYRIHALIVSDPAGLAMGVLSDFDILAGEWLAAGEGSQAAMRRVTVRELMSPHVPSVDVDQTAAEAAQRMRAEHLHRLVVTELDRPVGVITVSDLIGGLAPTSSERTLVDQVMSRGIVVCRENTSITAAARAMRERRSRSVVVVNSHGRPLGVVTGFDLLPFNGQGDTSQPVSAVMHPPCTIQPEATLRTAADLMLREHAHRLLVVDPAEPDSMPLGLVSTADIVLEMAAPGSSWQTKRPVK